MTSRFFPPRKYLGFSLEGICYSVMLEAAEKTCIFSTKSLFCRALKEVWIRTHMFLKMSFWQNQISNFFYLSHIGAKTKFLSRNYQEFDVWKMWILWKMKLWKCEFCEKWEFEIVNFVKNEIFKMWILWKIRLWNCEFCEKW